MSYPNNQIYQGMPPSTGYQNTGMHNSGYNPYNHYSRPSPSMQPYVSMMGVGSQNYNVRQSQPSPALATPYQPPPVPAPMAPHTPNSALSHTSQVATQPISPPAPQPMSTQPLVVSSDALHPAPSPAPPAIEPTIVAPSPAAAPAPAHVSPVTATSLPGTPEPTESTREPFRPPLPWLSMPDLPFPARTPKKKKKRTFVVPGSASLPEPTQTLQQKEQLAKDPQTQSNPLEHGVPAQAEDALSTPISTPTKPASPVAASLASDTTSSIAVATPSSSQEDTAVSSTSTVKLAPRAPVSAVPAVPIVPVLPKPNPKDARHLNSEKSSAKPIEPAAEVPSTVEPTVGAAVSTLADEPASVQAEEKQATSSTPSPAPASKVAPRSWASLLTSAASASKEHSATSSDPNTTPNGTPLADGQAATANNATFGKSATNTITEALRSYQVTTPEKVVFIQPRGLINTGNMCYMNSVLQVLIFCVPFYEFLDQINKKATHSFKSETPLIDAMVLFLREFKIIDAATSVEQLRRRLKAEELETFGEPFTPEFVYDIIRRLPRFVDMRVS
jgi:ubiquitin carboxyl-terminal hydrolase 10